MVTNQRLIELIGWVREHLPLCVETTAVQGGANQQAIDLETALRELLERRAAVQAVKIALRRIEERLEDV